MKIKVLALIIIAFFIASCGEDEKKETKAYQVKKDENKETIAFHV